MKRRWWRKLLPIWHHNSNKLRLAAAAAWRASCLPVCPPKLLASFASLLSGFLELLDAEMSQEVGWGRDISLVNDDDDDDDDKLNVPHDINNSVHSVLWSLRSTCQYQVGFNWIGLDRTRETEKSLTLNWIEIASNESLEMEAKKRLFFLVEKNGKLHLKFKKKKLCFLSHSFLQFTF